MKKLTFLIFSCIMVCVCPVLAYRLDEWEGEQSDEAVQAGGKGYRFYFCDKGKCFAAHLDDQEVDKILQILKPYSGETVDNALSFVRMESQDRPAYVWKVLNDFKVFRGINSVGTVLDILRNAKGKN